MPAGRHYAAKVRRQGACPQRKETIMARLEDTNLDIMEEKKRAAKGTKTDPELVRRRKEEKARRSRRMMRQLLGAALSVLVVVGAVSVVFSGIELYKTLTDNQAEKKMYEELLEPMVWFNVLPFESLAQVDEDVLKEIAIWGVEISQQGQLQRNENDELLIPTVEVDRFAAKLFGPDYQFTVHESFSNMEQGLHYGYDAQREVYVMPSTGLTPEYRATVVRIKNEGGGVRRVTVGYVSALDENKGIIFNPDYDHPVKYMDFMFQRGSGGSYYLYALQKNTTIEPAVPSSDAASVPSVAPPSSSEEEDILPSVSVPDEGGDISSEATSEPAA